MDRIQLRRRLDTSKGVPIIDKRMLRGGMENINLRRQIKCYGDEVKKFELGETVEKPVLKKTRFSLWSID